MKMTLPGMRLKSEYRGKGDRWVVRRTYLWGLVSRTIYASPSTERVLAIKLLEVNANA